MAHQKFSDTDFSKLKGEAHEGTCYEGCLQCCGNLSGCLKIWCPCVCCCCTSPIYQLQTAKLGILQSFGRFKEVISPGLHLINPMTEDVIPVDMKTVIMNMQRQQVITKDNVSLQIETVVYYRTINPYKLAYKLGTNQHEIGKFINQMGSASLRTVVGEHIFQDLLVKRTELAEAIEVTVKQSVETWGLYIENIFIKDLILTHETKKNLESAAIQRRISEAQIISAQADVQVANMLKETSEVLNTSSAMQIRYLETIQNIIDRGEKNTVFINLKGKE